MILKYDSIAECFKIGAPLEFTGVVLNVFVSAWLIDRNKLPSIYITDYFNFVWIFLVCILFSLAYHHHHNIIRSNWSQIITNLFIKAPAYSFLRLSIAAPNCCSCHHFFCRLNDDVFYYINIFLCKYIFPFFGAVCCGNIANCVTKHKQIQFQERVIHHFYVCSAACSFVYLATFDKDFVPGKSCFNIWT